MNGVAEVKGIAGETTEEKLDEGILDLRRFEDTDCFPPPLHTGVLIFLTFAEKGVPDFWLTAMKQNEVLTEEVI